MKDMIMMRDKLRKAADIIDEFICLKEKENEGVDITNECESILGRFMITMTKLQEMQI